MVVKVQPVTPSLPATTAIQDPAVRRFAQSVADILRTHQSKEYAVQQLTKAAEGLIGVDSPGTPPSIRDWLASSDLYAKLTSSIDRIDIEAKRAIIEEQEARVQAIADEAESRANEIALEIAARIAAVQAEADLRAQGLLTEAEARGAAIASEATVRQSEDESIAQSVTTLTSSVNNSLAGIEEELTTLSTNLGAEASERQTLAAQMRGSYTGNDLSGITTGLLYKERIARATADQGLAQQITLLSAGTGEQFDHFNIWYFDDGVEGWVGNGAPTVTGGWLRPANHATDPYVSSPAGLGAEGSTYSQVRVRVRKTGSPAWAGALYWRGAADSTWDVARGASFPEPVFDANGIGLATVNLTWTGEIDRIRIDLSMAQTATDFFEIDWIAVGRPSPGASAAALLQEQIARASADAAEAASREALSVKLVGQADPDNLTLGTIASGLLYDEKLARSTADSTEVSKRESLSAKLTGFNDPTGKTLVDLSSGLIYEEKVARANEVEAVASTVTALVTRMGEAESAITTEQTTRSNADSAMASSITGLTAQLGGNITYSVLKQFEFVSGVEGWVGVGATISNAGGSYLAMVTTAANPYISYTLPTADRYQGSLATKIRARIRRISGASVWEGRCYYTTAAHNASDSYRKVVAAPKDPATWTIVEWDMSALTNGGNDYATNEIRAIRLDLVSGAGDAWDIDWISIGEKVVSPASYDVQQVNAAITDEAKVRADADTATTSRISTMRSQLGVTEEGALVDGFILDERNTRVSNDSAIVSAINTALASITGVSNAISQSGENLVANWTSAQATKWNQIEAEVVGEGGNTIRAALQQESITRANADGSLGAQWTLKTDINGYISGFGFASTANNATPTSEFIIRADKFAVVMPGYGDYVPFAVGSFGPMLLDSGGFNVPINDLVSASANPTSFLESFQSGNLAQWTNYGGSGELSVVSASDSLTGGKVLRIGNNSGNDQAWLIHKQNIPFDPSALYRIKFRVRRTAGTGTVYLGVAGVAADGVTWVNTSGANGSSSQHYVAASGQNPGSAWTEYVGYVKGTAATGQSGTNPSVTAPLKLHQNVRYIRPLIVANYQLAAGTLEVDYCSIEPMTDAMNWDAVAGEGKDAIVNTLADIASDSKLTPAEKKSIRKEWDAIYAERAGIRAQADSFGITTEKTNYDNDFQALGTYLNGGTAYTIGATPPSWITDANLSTTTTIVGTTFRNYWKNMYADRQALLNKIAAEAAKRADWTLTAGKPDDEDILNAGHPLNKNPDLQGAVNGAETAPSWTRVVAGPEPAFAGIRIEAAGSTYGPPWDREAPMFYATIADTANAPNEQAYWVSEGFKIDTSKPHCLSGWARKMWLNGTPKVYFRVRCYDKDGVSLGFISRYSAYTGLTTTWEQMVKRIEPADWPAGTYKVRIEWYGAYQQYGSSVATRLMLNEGRVPTKNLAPPVVDIDAHLTRNGTSVLADDFVATWNKINSSNILTYMGTAAITEAVIGTAAISTAKIKDGAITTAKIGDAQVETLSIAGNAVIVPTFVEYPSGASYNEYQIGTAIEWTLLSDVVTVHVDCSAIITIGSNDEKTSVKHTVSAGASGRGHYNWPTGTEWASILLYRNGTLVKRLAQWNVGGKKKGAGKHMGVYIGIEQDCVFVDELTVQVDLVAGANTIDIRGWVRMADGDACARRLSNAYMQIIGAQR
jgi:hypothetical protein